MNLLKIIRRLFTGKQKEKTLEQVTEWHDDSQDFTHEVMGAYEETQRQLALRNLDMRHYDVAYQVRQAEYERQSKYKIKFEFIPQSQNFKNVRSALHYTTQDYKAWQHIRNNEEAKVNAKCCICGGTNFEIERFVEEGGKKVLKPYTAATECHERWHYDDDKKIQTLVGLSSICVTCHNVFHCNMHLRDKEKMLVLFDLYCDLNNVSHERCQKDFEFALAEKKRMDEVLFKIDMSLLENEYSKFPLDNPFDPHTFKFTEFIDTVFNKDKNNKEE